MRNWIRSIKAFLVRGFGTSLAALLALCATARPAAADQAYLSYNVNYQGIAIVTNLTASTGPAPGYLTITWTAPGVNSVTAPLRYDIRVSSVANMNNNADFNAASALSVFSTATIPAPQAGGTVQSLAIPGLIPGVTYYFAIREFDSAVPPASGAWTRRASKGWNQNNFAVVPSSLSFTVQGFTGFSGFKVAVLCWQDLTAQQKGPTFQGYDLYRSTQFPTVFSSLVVTSSTCYTDAAVSVGSTYYYMVTGKLAPTFETSPSSTVAVLVHSASPLPPVGVGISMTSATATISWQNVVAYVNGVSFATANAANPGELEGFTVYRATAPILAPWTPVAVISSTTLTFTDTPPVLPSYYYVSAFNLTDTSRPSVTREIPNGDAIVVLPDGYSTLDIPMATANAALGVGAATPWNAYDVYCSSRPQDLTNNPTNGVGAILKSMDIEPLGGALNYSSQLTLTGLATLKLHYGLSGPLVSPSGLKGQGVLPTPDSVSIYWFNGTKWLQMYGTLDSVGQYFTLQTSYLGRYQLRAVERAGGFNVDVSGLSNRLLTPNGDGKNDTVVIVFDNPKDSAVTGKVYDIKGAAVATMTQGPIANSLMWDGKSNGKSVPGGVYIYQIQAEGKTFNGTIVVVK